MLFRILFTISAIGLITAQTSFADTEAKAEWKPLLSMELSENWEAWIGVPHKSVTVPGYPPSTSEDGTTGTPIGLVDVDNDPLDLFTMIEEEGQPVLKISGQVYAGLTSKSVHKNYHLSLQFKWGEKKWPPRQTLKRDSGLLLHCTGAHGAFWNVWMADIECQIQEGDCGDLFCLAGATAKVRSNHPAEDLPPRYDPNSNDVHQGNAKHSHANEKPHGEWNTIEAYVLEDTMVFVVNGEPNMAVHQVTYQDKRLSEGKIQIQSEGAEIYYRDIKIRPMNQFPDFLANHVRPIED